MPKLAALHLHDYGDPTSASDASEATTELAPSSRLAQAPRRRSRPLSSRFDLKKSPSYGVGTRPDASPNSIGALPCLDSVRFSPITESGSRRVGGFLPRDRGSPDRRTVTGSAPCSASKSPVPAAPPPYGANSFNATSSAQALISRAPHTGAILPRPGWLMGGRGGCTQERKPANCQPAVSE
jgi:hypothetical protein